MMKADTSAGSMGARPVRTFSQLPAAVARAVKAGVSEDAAAREIDLPQYAHLQRYKEWKPHDVRAAYGYLRGK
jgi:hypothetical protein